LGSADAESSARAGVRFRGCPIAHNNGITV
jgi:hypothetical protein